MKSFFCVLKFELSNYFQNKLYLISTILISLVLIVTLTLPSVIDLSSFTGTKEKDITIGICDANSIIDNIDYFEQVFKDNKLIMLDNEEELNEKVKDGDINAGFVINSLTEYSYYVYNKQANDQKQKYFEMALSRYYREVVFNNIKLNVDQIDSIYNTPINSTVNILGKDSGKNYFYTYAMIFILYIIVIMYGQLVATSITVEKSNRTIELLVTSTNSNSLIFGKVIAGAIASFAQFSIILLSGIITYKVNSSFWNGSLDFIFDIPVNVLIVFIIFGVIGYIFYSFIYGMLGALVSKTEDVSKSASIISILYVIVFMLSLMNLNNSDGLLIKIMSFIPFSSPNAIIIRVAMGTISQYEVIISLIILIISTILVGIISSKIYKKTVLIYENRIKLTSILRLLKKD